MNEAEIDRSETTFCSSQDLDMGKITTTRYDVAEYLRTPEEMAAYLEGCIEESGGDAAFIASALGDIARAKGMSQVARDAGLFPARVSTKLCPESVRRALTRS